MLPRLPAVTAGALRLALCLLFAHMAPAHANQCGVFAEVPAPGPSVVDGGIANLAALGDGTAWASGMRGGEVVLVYFDGAQWSSRALPTQMQGVAFGASITTPAGDTWFAGTRAHDVYNVEVFFLRLRAGEFDAIYSLLNPRAPVDLSATASGEVWALTAGGDVLRFVGSEWQLMDLPEPYQRLYPGEIHANATDDVWVAGYGGNVRSEYIGYVQHWNGSSWEQVSTPFDGLRNHFFRGVHGSAADQVWIVGHINYSQTIAMLWGGNDWTSYPGPASNTPLLDVAVLGVGDAWASAYVQSEAEQLYHWDGLAWRGMAPLADPGVTMRWQELALAGQCDLWTTGTYAADPGTRSLVARMQPGAAAEVVFVQDVVVSRPSAEADFASATVTLATLGGEVAEGVEVSGMFTGPAVEQVSGLSDFAGQALLSASPTGSASGVWCFDVTALARPGWLYDPSRNTVSGACEDSAPAAATYVSRIEVSKLRAGKSVFQGEALVTVTDTDGQPVPGVVVTGAFSGATSEVASAATDAKGVAAMLSASVSRRSARAGWCFTVDTVAADDYDPALNIGTSACSSN